MGKQNKGKICPNCNHAIEADDQFCSRCGREVRHYSGRKPRRRIRRNQNWQWVLVSVLVAALLVILGMASSNSGNKRAAYLPRDTPQVRSIVSAFDCSCGKCILALKDCECPTAQETTDYIARAVADGKYTRKEIVRMVNGRYGHLIDRSELQS